MVYSWCRCRRGCFYHHPIQNPTILLAICICCWPFLFDCLFDCKMVCGCGFGCGWCVVVAWTSFFLQPDPDTHTAKRKRYNSIGWNSSFFRMHASVNCSCVNLNLGSFFCATNRRMISSIFVVLYTQLRIDFIVNSMLWSSGLPTQCQECTHAQKNKFMEWQKSLTHTICHSIEYIHLQKVLECFFPSPHAHSLSLSLENCIHYISKVSFLREPKQKTATTNFSTNGTRNKMLLKNCCLLTTELNIRVYLNVV